MSYSFDYDCEECQKKEACTDRHVVQGAINAIHSMPFGVGHLGSGCISLDCQNILRSNSKE